MSAVAARVGVRPPSLYKRVRNRDELIRLVAEAGVAELGDLLAAADHGGDPRDRLGELAGAVRSFARSRPGAYRLVFSPRAEGVEVARPLLEATSAPLFAVVAELAGPADALVAARTVTAWVTGFLAMELNDAFRLGGEVDVAFDYGVARLADAVTADSR
jgi:AcrR family transcriptional regulator